jgi:hypothetical protein
MNKEEAIKLVNDYLIKAEEESNAFGSGLPGYVNPEIKLQIITEYTEEHNFGWVFYYDSVKHLQTRDFRDELAGNAPLIVNKHTDELIETGTVHQTSYYVKWYKKHGNLNGS